MISIELLTVIQGRSGCMKHKVYKIMVAVFVLCLYLAGDENTDKDIGEIQKNRMQKTEA